MRVTAADLDERRILAPARRLGRGRLTTPARTPQVGGPATGPASKYSAPKSSERQSDARASRASARRLQRAAAPREWDIQRDVLAYLASMPGVYAWKAGAGLIPTSDGRRVRMGKAGVSDVIGWTAMHMIGGLGEMRVCRRPRDCYFSGHVPVWLGIEVKRPGQKATPAQLDFLARLREAGSPLAMVASSVDQVRRAVESL